MKARGITLLPVMIITAIGSLIMYRTYEYLYSSIYLRNQVAQDESARMLEDTRVVRSITLDETMDLDGCVQKEKSKLCFDIYRNSPGGFTFNNVFTHPDSCKSTSPTDIANLPSVNDIISPLNCTALESIENIFITHANLNLSSTVIPNNIRLIASAGTFQTSGRLDAESSLHIISMGSVHIDELFVQANARVTIFSLREINVGAVIGNGTLKITGPRDTAASQYILPWLGSMERTLWSLTHL